VRIQPAPFTINTHQSSRSYTAKIEGIEQVESDDIIECRREWGGCGASNRVLYMNCKGKFF
jgi:hypothetical protein